tara:strand:+ start:559 stop:1497 length:939 start_codon:yes stop_codon:yes gene_type:complete
MAGILDKKTRFMDTYLTDRGRQELAKGELRFSFALFSDYGTFYEGSMANPNVAESPANRIYFEAANRPQDLVIPEFDADGGMLFPAGGFDIVNGELKVLTGSKNLLKGADLVTSASSAISDSMESFVEMRPLRSEEAIAKTTGFELSDSSKVFPVTVSKPIAKSKPNSVMLDNVESLWQDAKLSHVDNFQHLPPINKTSGNELKEYPKIQQPAPASYDDLRRELEGSESGGWTGVGDPATIKFDKTSPTNNLVCQVWEVTSSSMNKLRMIDFGEFEDADPFSPGKRVYFVGKLMDDDTGDQTFINLFTVVFD